MKPLTCAATRRRLQAFHDRELAGRAIRSPSARTSSGAIECAAALAELRMMRDGAAMRSRRAILCCPTKRRPASAPAVVSRLKAEQRRSCSGAHAQRVRRHALRLRGTRRRRRQRSSASLIMLSMMRFATTRRPDSLAGIVSMLARHGRSNASSATTRSTRRSAASDGVERCSAARNEAAAQDAVFTLEAVVTREGRLANLDGVHAGGRTSRPWVRRS